MNVDIGRGDKHRDLLARYGIKPEGYPYLAVIDATTDKLIKQQETGALEEGDHHDPVKVKAFLESQKAPPVDGAAQLTSALAQAKAQGKRVLLRFGATWCGPCHMLDDVLYKDEVVDALAGDFVLVKIDIDRTTNGKALQAKYGASGGIPWYAVLDADGKTTFTSEMPGTGNIGFPTEPPEVAHVVKMLTAEHKHMSDAQIAAVKSAFEVAAAKFHQAH